jgi:predicted nucleic acid-binding protein
MTADEAAFVDTNVFVRWLTQDEPAHGARATEFLKRVENGELAVTTSEAVIVELVYVLQSKRLYSQTRPQIRDAIGDLLSLKSLRLPPKTVYLRALDLYVQNPSIDFVDCLNLAHMEHAGVKEIWTFDKDYSHVKGISGVVSREP